MITIETFQCGRMGTNCYVASDDITKRGFMVDPGGQSGKLDQYLAENEIQIEYILLTHGHGDHIGGVKHYKSMYPDVKILAGIDEKEVLSDPKKNYSKMTVGQEIAIDADVFVEDGDVKNIAGIDLVFLSTPGHTMGGICIYIPEEQCLFSGDTLFAQSVGRTDLGGSQAKLQRSIREKLFTLSDDTRVLPGHLGETAIGIEKEYNPFV